MNESWDTPPRDPDAMNDPADVPAPTPATYPHAACSDCGYDLVSVPVGANCPQCNRTTSRESLRPVAPHATHVTCPNCGYNLTGVAIGGSCPECNLVIGRGTIQNPNLPTSGNAIAALVLGICAIVIGCGTYGLAGLVCGPLAIYFAGSARRQVATGQFSQGSLGLATAGKVMGLIGLSLACVVMVLVILAFGIPLAIALFSA